MSQHTHKCGFDIPSHMADVAMMEGCGFEWTHDVEGMTPEEQYKAHICPKCKLGPWTRHYDQHTIKWRRQAFARQRRILQSAIEGDTSKSAAYYDAIIYLGQICHVLKET